MSVEEVFNNPMLAEAMNDEILAQGGIYWNCVCQCNVTILNLQKLQDNETND